MRFAFPPLTPVVRIALIVLFVSFVLQSLVEGALAFPVYGFVGLHYDLAPGLAWQWATYPLIEIPSDGMVFGRALSLLMLYFWVAPFEVEFGPRNTTALLVLSVVGGALLPLLFGFAVPSLSLPYAGAGVLFWGGIGALVIRARGEPLNLFLLPPMSAWAFVGIFLLFDALQCSWMRTPTPLLASVGALGAGYAFTRWLRDRPSPSPKGPGRKRRASGARLSVIQGGRDDDKPRYLN